MAKAARKMGAEVEEISRVLRVPRIRIRPCQTQPRTFFDQARLEELSDSIRTVGQQVPIILRVVTDDPNFDYEIVDGERRWIAAGMADVDTMIAWVTEVTDENALFDMSVAANHGRDGHTVLDSAHAMQRMRDYRSVEEIAQIFAKSTVWVYQHLAILKMPPQVLNLMGNDVPEDRRIVLSTAVKLTSVPNPELQIACALDIYQQGLGVMAAKHLIEQKCAEAGVEIGMRRGRTPNKDYTIFQGFWKRTLQQLTMFEESTVERYQSLFKHRNPTDAEELVGMLEKSHTSIANILAMLRQAIEEGQ